MSMHIEGPWLSTTGKRKGKFKYASADKKREHEDLDARWKELQKRWATENEEKRARRALTAPAYVPPKMSMRGAEMLNKPSLQTGNGVAARAEDKVYTGTKVKGIGTMHKSNAVPIFSDDEAIDISRMRR
jgi:hypothetical protein